jgi:hypothetical protein
MKLLVRKLWFPHSVDETVTALFRIPQMKEQFDEGFAYDGEMRPRGIKICSGYWPADDILDKLPDSENDVYLVLTSMELKGDYGRINGKGSDRKAIASTNGSTDAFKRFHSWDYGFYAMAFEEIGHALGLQHHEFNPSNPCEMSRNNVSDHHWLSLDEVRFCNDCYQLIK